MEVSQGLEAGINSFALVSYLTGPLAEFLDQLRHDFAPDSRAKAHVTILPPRPLQYTPRADNIERAWQQLRDQMVDIPPFQVELGEVEVFRLNRVVYLAIQAGTRELHNMHDALNRGLLEFQEPFPYHPHVTIVQELSPEDVPEATQFARWRWSEFRHERKFAVERITFVQNTLENHWKDLKELVLASQVAL